MGHEALMDEPDEYHLQRCRDGHSEDFRVLVRRYEKVVIARLAATLRDRQRAEEAAQETFVRAFFALSKLREPRAFAGWLLGIAERVAMEQQRDEIRQRKLQCIPQHGPSSENHLDEEMVRQAVGRLPNDYREIVLLRFYGECTCAEIATKLKMPLGSVTKMLSRAYSMLREAIDEQEVRS